MYFRSRKKLQGEVSLNDSLDSGADGESLYLMDVVGVEDTMYLDIQDRDDCLRVRRLVHECLTEREEEVIISRYGLGGRMPRTQREVAKKLGIPFISSTTTFAFNRYSAKVMKQSGGQMLKMLLAMPKINHDLQRLRDRGYPIKNILDIIQNDARTDTIVYTSPEFQPCADTFSDKYAFVGPSIRPATETVEKAHDVLIYISMGTVNNDLLPFYRACIAAFADSPYQVILSTGEQIDRSALGTLPDNITALPHVDQIAVLQKADVFLSHCGMNSASESLYFGVPLVLFPQTNEQGGVSARVAELGAGLKLEKADAASIRTAVDAVLQTPSYRANAQNIRESFLRCGGAKAAVDRILSVADRK